MKRIKFASLMLLLAAGVANSQDDLGTRARAVMNKNVGSVVTIRAVLNVEVMGQSQEIRINSKGTLVTASGMVMTTNQLFHPNIQVRGRKVEATITPNDVKITFGKEEKEYDAFLAAKDPKLDLAFLKILDLEGRKVKAADLSKSVTPKLGQRFVILSRLDKAFDYTPTFTLGMVINKIKKPRKAYKCTFSAGSGQVVYDLDGNLLGATVRLTATGANDRSVTSSFLATGKVVGAVVKNALKQAKEMEEEEKAKAAERKEEKKDEDEESESEEGGKGK